MAISYEEQLLRADLNLLTTKEQRLTEHWYRRMSGEVPFGPGDKEWCADQFTLLSSEIRTVQDQIAKLSHLSV